jgi:hypothetical protein
MSTVDEILALFVQDTLKVAQGVLLLIVAYKIYKLKCDSTSNCGRFFTFHGSNPGGSDEVLNQNAA